MESDKSLLGTPGSASSLISTGSSLAPDDRILSVKCSIDSIGWYLELHKILEYFVLTVKHYRTCILTLPVHFFAGHARRRGF